MPHTFKILTWVPEKGGIPAHVADLRVRAVPELPIAERTAWEGCSGCVGTDSVALCKKLKHYATTKCQSEQVIYKVDLELH